MFSCVQLFMTPWTVARQAPLQGDFPGKNTGVDCHFLFQGSFRTKRSNPHLLCLLHWKRILYRLSHYGSPWQRWNSSHSSSENQTRNKEWTRGIIIKSTIRWDVLGIYKKGWGFYKLDLPRRLVLSRKPRTRSVKKLVQGHTESKDLNLGLIRIGLQNLGGGEGGFFLPYKIINERITSNITADKGPYSQSYSFSSSLVWM